MQAYMKSVLVEYACIVHTVRLQSWGRREAICRNGSSYDFQADDLRPFKYFPVTRVNAGKCVFAFELNLREKLHKLAAEI